MDKKIVFSVIIPVYNMELYLERCLNSVINQSYRPLEIIIINDGSTDKSLGIINSFAKRDKRIIVIDKENEGIGGAYIDALKIVTGDYISFIDSDDFVDTNMYEVLALHAREKRPDIIQFGYQKFDETGTITHKINFGEGFIVGNYNVNKYRDKKISHPSIGLKVMKKELFDGVELLRQNVGIDVLLSLYIYIKAQSLFLIKDQFYHVFNRAGSVSRISYDLNKTNQLERLRSLMFKVTMATKDKDVIQRMIPTFVNETIIISNYYFKNNEVEISDKYIDEYKAYYNLLFSIIIKSGFRSFIKSTIFRHFPKTYLRFRKHR